MISASTVSSVFTSTTGSSPLVRVCCRKAPVTIIGRPRPVAGESTLMRLNESRAWNIDSAAVSIQNAPPISSTPISTVRARSSTGFIGAPS